MYSNYQGIVCTVAWPSGLRRWFKAPVSSEAWVRIPPLPLEHFALNCNKNQQVIIEPLLYTKTFTFLGAANTSKTLNNQTTINSS